MVNALTIVGAAVAVLVVGGFVAYVVVMYNRLIRVQKRADNAWSDIDVLLKQRRDQLGKLVDAVSEVMDHEEEVLTELTEARERVSDSNSPEEAAAAGETIRSSLQEFSMRAEDYPELKSSNNVMQLQEQIATLESQIADRREVYNAAATNLNTLVNTIPYVFFAKLVGVGERELYDPPAGETADVDMSQLTEDASAESAQASS